ncbi:MAG: hypothetical protein HY901_05820, partial [Deltaproteobacteria bacterium]|nr:hypothetical protein [Deltaproteobacteria bacterium]
CSSGSGCGAARRPQADYFGGEVLITANAQTTGHSVPSGAEFIDSYYRQGGTKDLASHFGLMGTSGLHLMSVAYRGEEDMTFWVNGRGRTDRLELEWDELFGQAPVRPDAGVAGPDASSPPGPDAGEQPIGVDAAQQPPLGIDAADPVIQTDANAQADAGPGAQAGADASVPPIQETGGCSTGGEPVAALAIVALLAVARRRRWMSRG